MLIDRLSSNNKGIVLGSAMWGWTSPKKDVFSLLDSYHESGYRLLDQANNYPINGLSKDHGLGLKWLSEWLDLNSSKSFEVIVKIGSVNNIGSPDNDLSPKGIEDAYWKLKEQLGDSLACISIHWDDRIGDNDYDQILSTLEALNRLAKLDGCRLGFSGIRSPKLYADFFSENSVKPIIQVKENILTSRNRTYYSGYFDDANYLAYGINLGGSRNSKEDLNIVGRGMAQPQPLINSFDKLLQSSLINPAPKNHYDIALYLTYVNAALSGVIIGPRNSEQLYQILEFWNKLELNSDNLMTYSSLKSVLCENHVLY